MTSLNDLQATMKSIESILQSASAQGLDSAANVLLSRICRGVDRPRNGGILINWISIHSPPRWLHSVCPGVLESHVCAAERELGFTIPIAYRNFLLAFNGMRLFCAEFGLPTLLLMGIAAIPRVLSAEECHPVDFLADNTISRPRGLSVGELVFGSYATDGAILSIDPKGKIRRRDTSMAEIGTWSSFSEFFNHEVQRLDRVFDSNGVLIAAEG